MKLLFLFNSRIAKRGSFEDLMLSLAREIRRRGDSCAFVLPGLGVADFELGRLAPVHLVDPPWDRLRAAWDIGRIIERERPDVINAHFCDTLNFLPLYAWARLRGIRVVCHYHGEIVPLHQVRWFKQHLSALRLVTMPVHRVVTVSRANARYLSHLRVMPQVDVIYNGIDLRRFDGRASAGGALPDGRYICYLGSLIPRKRVDFLLRAFRQVAARVADVTLVVAGGGDVEGHRALAAELGVSSRVLFTGLLPEYPLGWCSTPSSWSARRCRSRSAWCSPRRSRSACRWSPVASAACPRWSATASSGCSPSPTTSTGSPPASSGCSRTSPCATASPDAPRAGPRALRPERARARDPGGAVEGLRGRAARRRPAAAIARSVASGHAA